MFEKEAEEYANQSCFTEMLNSSLSESIDISDDIKEAVLFGYNKANEWHYVKDGKPKDNEYVLIYTDLKNIYMAKIPTGKNYFIAMSGGFVQMSAVIAWKEIVPPETKV